MTAELLSRYEALLERGVLRPDAAQRAAVRQLAALHGALERWTTARRGVPGFRRPRLPPHGLYIWGGVGHGKSMLMDLFFEGAAVAGRRRAHFHAFMQDVHERIFAFRQTATKAASGDPIAPVARDLAQQARLLCFDEFQVTNIADAAILGRLFSQLFELGVVVVATSNTAPEALYAGGLNRRRFLPFIALLQERLNVLHLEARTDYRLDRLRGRPMWFQPLNGRALAAMEEAWGRITHGAARPAVLRVKGRHIPVPAAAMGAARFSFEALCARPLGAGDYLALALAYHTLLLDGIPAMEPARRNEAARFAMLIDALYEHKVKLMASAACAPGGLYPEGDGHAAFRRTASRLQEMQSEDYVSAGHAV